MKSLTKEEFEVLANRCESDRKYFIDGKRWEYFQMSISIAEKLNIDSVLELGPHTISLFHDSDIMDKSHHARLSSKLTYLMDACSSWDNVLNYDLLVALQVFEHFEGKQKEVWIEVCKHCTYAIVSIPYKWSKFCGHIGLDENTLQSWIGESTILESHITKNNMKRLICLIKC